MARRPTRSDPRPSLEQRLAAVAAADASSAAGIATIRAALVSDVGLLVAAAARRVAEDGAAALAALVDELVPAFERLLEQPVKRDPGCRGKVAIVKALHALDRWDDRVFAAGLRHVQREGWGTPPDDTAAELRGLCGIAHAQFGRHDALDVLAALLADPEPIARTAAARGLADSGQLAATALLRYKLLVGDEAPEVLGACAESLLSLAREASTPFLIDLLAEHDDRAEVIVLALGSGRVAAAFDALTAWCVGAADEQRHIGYLALALLRTDAATTYLLDAIAGNARAVAVAAARALATFKDDTTLRERIRVTAAARKDAALRREIDAMLDS